MASYSCVANCGQCFRSERGLARHQDACRIAQNIWTHDLQEAAMNREKAKRQKLSLTRWSEAGKETQTPVSEFLLLPS